MIKQGHRKSLKAKGTVLLVNRAWPSDNPWSYIAPTLIGGDLLMITGDHLTSIGHLRVINVATACAVWVSRRWLIENTTLAFDARVSEATQDA